MVKFSSMSDGKTGAGSTGRRSTGERLSFRQLAAQSQLRPQANSRATVSGGRSAASGEDRKELYGEASDYLTAVMASIRGEEPFSLDPAIDILERVADIQTPLDSLFLKAIHSDESHNFVVNHSVNSAIYAMKMAETLGFSKTRQVEIGMLGLFHDVGMALISDEIVYKKERLSDREFKALKDRPNLGYEILKIFENDYPFLAEGTLQAYERADGSGYPKGLIGDEIHEYAQIVGLVDVYEALIHTRPQRQRLPHFFAVKEIIRTGKSQFQRRYLKALLNTFSIFPLFSYVRLNSKAIGQVVKTYPDQPMRPKVRVIYDSQKQRVLTERMINLPENPLLYITDSMSEEELLAISESSDLVADKGHSAVPADTTGSGKTKQGRGRKKIIGKRRFPFFRLGWTPVIIALGLLLLAGVSGYFGSRDRSLPRASAMATPSNTPDQKNPGHEAALDQPPEMAKSVEARNSAISTPGIPKAESAATHLPVTVAAVVGDASSGGESANTEAGSDPVETVPVKVENNTLSPEETDGTGAAVENRPDWEPGYPFSIKFSSHKTRAQAQNAVDQLYQSGIDAYWVKVDLGTDGTWHRVFAGYFENAGQANAFIQAQNLRNAKVKQTRYSNLVGSFPNFSGAEEEVTTLREKGFSPYTIEQAQQTHVLVGVFFTQKGAKDQYAELLASGISSRVINR
jgi:HD-GYP domain-containing protein (c-di-GMP phosphodiesterase class II)/cell division septation protein DedD